MAPAAAPIEFQSDDGITIRGLRVDGSDEWLLLVHDCDGDSDLDSWRPLIPALASDNWSLLAVDLRGHGASDGEWSPSTAGSDLMAAIKFTQSHGAKWIAVLAAGRSAIAALEIATNIALDALVLLSPAPAGEALADDLRGQGEAKLFAVGGKDMALQHAVSSQQVDRLGDAGHGAG